MCVKKNNASNNDNIVITDLVLMHFTKNNLLK